MRRLFAACLLLLCALPAGAQKLTAVRFGKLWDGEKVIDRALVVIDGGRIRSVRPAIRRRPPAPTSSTGPATTASRA